LHQLIAPAFSARPSSASMGPSYPTTRGAARRCRYRGNGIYRPRARHRAPGT